MLDILRSEIFKQKQQNQYLFKDYLHIKILIYEFFRFQQLLQTLNLEHMTTEPKLELYYPTYWLSALLQDQKLNIVALNYYSTHPKKHLVSIDLKLDHYKGLHVFQSCEQLLRLLKSGKNHEYNQTTGILYLKWKIKAYSFEKDVIYEIKMMDQPFSEFDKLKIQNHMLKKKLEKYQQITIDKSDSQFSVSATKQKHLNDSKNIQQEKQKNIEVIQLINSDRKQQLNEAKKDGQRKGKGRPGQRKIKLEIQNDALQKANKQKKRGRRKKLNHSDTAAQKSQTTQASHNMVKISFQNGDYYYGQIKNNLYHGHGLYFSSTNGTFEGEWENGKANGYGISKDLSGNQHTGFYINDKRSGKGIDIYTNGQRYEGEFELDAKSGRGKYCYANGDTYEGQWKNDLYHGYGKQTYHNGSMYEGNWVSDEKDGAGVFTDVDGTRWKQLWDKGIKIREEQVKAV